MADIDFVANFEIEVAAPYSISKAAVNAAVAKFHAQYAAEGVLFMSIAPGIVDTGHHNNLTEEQTKVQMGLGAKFIRYAPHFTGPSTPEMAVMDVISVMNEASLKSGHGGSFISHLGTKQWL
ncbi:hypothetical protein BJ170DRAFT_681398 [Xylariales sp. AK1849]|nr:hypothetical protein BJ170DRAFT_681398 [Xylariales sp. AK1849]